MAWIPFTAWDGWPELLKQAIDEDIFPLSHAPFSKGEITVKPMRTWLISVPSHDNKTTDILLTEHGDIYTFATRPTDGTGPIMLNDLGRKQLDLAVYLIRERLKIEPTEQTETPT